VAQPHHQKKSSEQGLEHRRILEAGLKLLSADDMKPSTPCPDSWTFALYVQGQVDEQTRRTINSHIAFCSECYREYVSLAEPEDVMKEIDRELHSTTATSPERSPGAWRTVMERLKGFVIDLGNKYGTGVFGSVLVIAETSVARGKHSSLKLSKLLETSIGNNTYRIQLGVRRDGSFECDIDGHKIMDETSLRLAVRRDTGEALFLTETNVHGNTNFVLAKEKVLQDILVLDLHLDGHESQIAFRMPT
jgi:hypothetical protein